LYTRLPPINVDSKIADTTMSLTEYKLKFQTVFSQAFAQAIAKEEDVVNYFKPHGFEFLKKRDVGFFCPCNKDRFILGLGGLKENPHALFGENEHLDITCDYCQKHYVIYKTDLNLIQ
jgi:redox-regulated HSP33 family molecular chaperone